jgi:hypothetical protein
LEKAMKKKVYMLLIALIVAGLFFNTSCKRKNRFDIRGTWVFDITVLGETFTENYTFVGDRQAGDVLWEGDTFGTYSVIDDFVSFTLEYYDIDDDYVVEVYKGYFDSRDYMSGDVTITIENYPTVMGDWVAY